MASKAANARRESGRAKPDDDAVDSLFDVPAAVLCATCGQADCPGCGLGDDTASGVVAIVPWERQAGGTWSRLWETAKATTHGADTFFAAMPDGELQPAVRFALLAELLAVTSMLMLFVPLLALALPRLALVIIGDPSAQSLVFRLLVIGIPILAIWMVAAHATHGAALDLGARRVGARGERRRALRFGLYACGWDLMVGPLGALVMLFERGWRSLGELLGESMTVPGRASLALLQGVYRLSPRDAARARGAGTVAAAAIALVSGILIVGASLLVR
jgi:hypothetical protein